MSDSRRSLLPAAEIGLMALTAAVVVDMGRLFAGDGWMGPLFVNGVVAHGVMILLRRRGRSLGATAVLATGAAALVVTWTTYWSTTTAGLPTGRTWSTMSADLGDAWVLYRDVVAPAPVARGFVLASCIALWAVAYLADWAAFRLWLPFEATLPAFTLFLFTALVGAEPGRTLAVALYATALLAFLLLHRLAHEGGRVHWVADRRRAGQRSLVRTAAGLGLVAVTAGSLLGPVLPGAGAPGWLDPRALKGGGSRVTVSPLVDIRSRLVNQAAVEVFSVRSPERSYWRLTALDRFDGRIWSSSGTYERAEGALPESVPSAVRSSSFDQTFTIAALSTIWLPTAYEPRAVSATDATVRFDPESSTLIVGNDETTSDGLTYDVTSRSPRIGPDDLAAAPDAEVPAEIRARYLTLPDDFSLRVRDLASIVTSGATTPADTARRLQDHLRTFRYSLSVQPGHSESALEDFLFETQTGYCEQFAGAFAAMARSLGLPTRVAVGFTPGDEDPEDPGLYRVRGEYAHAWPEVFLAGVGWVAYEPTPGRGIPNAEGYTGVPDQQAAPSNPGGSVAPSTTAPSSPIPSGPNTTLPREGPGLDAGGAGAASRGAEGKGAFDRLVARPIARAAPVAGSLALGYLVLFPLGVLGWHVLRRRRAKTPLAKIDLAWRESFESAALLGFPARPSDTVRERARHLAAVAPDTATAATALAERVEAAAYSAEGVSDDDVAAAQTAAAEVRAALRGMAPWPARVRRWLDPRSALGVWHRDHRSRQRRITLTARGDLEQERELVGSGDRR